MREEIVSRMKSWVVCGVLMVVVICQCMHMTSSVNRNQRLGGKAYLGRELLELLRSKVCESKSRIRSGVIPFPVLIVETLYKTTQQDVL